jgi:hypothetical protein
MKKTIALLLLFFFASLAVSSEVENRLNSLEKIVLKRLEKKFLQMKAASGYQGGYYLENWSEFPACDGMTNSFDCAEPEGIIKSVNDITNPEKAFEILSFSPLTVRVYGGVNAQFKDGTYVPGDTAFFYAFRYVWQDGQGWVDKGVDRQVARWDKSVGGKICTFEQCSNGPAVNVTWEREKQSASGGNKCQGKKDIFIELEKKAIADAKAKSDSLLGGSPSQKYNYWLEDVAEFPNCQGQKNSYSSEKENRGLYKYAKLQGSNSRAIEIKSKNPLTALVYFQCYGRQTRDDWAPDIYHFAREYIYRDEWSFTGKEKTVKIFQAENRWGLVSSFYQCPGGKPYYPDSALTESLIKSGQISPQRVPPELKK